MTGIADTGFIVAFANTHDEHHAWAVSLAWRVTEPLLTCEAVLAESAFKLLSASVVLGLVGSGLLKLAFDLEENRAQIEELAAKYQDRTPDLADLCLIRMSELYPEHPVITVDGDFKVYRRNKREPIPLLFPPARTG